MRFKSWQGTLVLTAFCVTLLTAEPSVYGGSYGGSSAQTKRNTKAIATLRQKVSQLQEEIEGLRSVVEGLNQQISQMQRRQRSAAAPSVTPETVRKLQERIEALEKRTAASKRSSSNTPSRSKRQAESPKPSKVSPPAKKRTTPSSDSRLAKASSKKLYLRGVRLVSQKRYDEAKKRFEILKERNYKPASTHFYLGEIAYRTGRYDDAIRYYQKSAELNENAAYMDRLLLHTGIALEKSGDKAQARNFFQAIVDGYPGTGSAAVAKKHLK